jgi:hypothetical protein
MANENRVLTTTTELLNETKGLHQAAQALAELGRDDEGEAILLEETAAEVRGWREHLQEAALKLGRRQRPQASTGDPGARVATDCVVPVKQ